MSTRFPLAPSDTAGIATTITAPDTIDPSILPTAAQPDIPQTLRLPTTDETIASNYSAVVVGDYEIASGTVLDIQSNAVLEIS